MANKIITLDKDIALIVMQYAKSIQGKVQKAMASPVKNGDTLSAINEQAEQIEWYIGELVDPVTYKRDG